MTAPSRSQTPVAPDGQRIVDQRGEVAEERAQIETEARRQQQLAQEGAVRTPSVRFWSAGTGRVGAVLALLAGVFTFGIRVWPIAVPQAHGSLGGFWFLAINLIATAYVVSFFLADRQWKLARGLLLGAAALHLVVGLGSGALVEAQDAAPGMLAMPFDLVPAVVAVVAAFLVGPAPSRAEYREHEAHAERRDH